MESLDWFLSWYSQPGEESGYGEVQLSLELNKGPNPAEVICFFEPGPVPWKHSEFQNEPLSMGHYEPL